MPLGYSPGFAWKKLLDRYPWEVYSKDTPPGGICKKGERPMGTEHTTDCACHKTKERTPEEYQSLIHRLNRIEGQIRGIRGMVEKNAYCPDILTQVAAAQAALNSFNKELLASHIRTCVAQDIRSGKDEVIDELVQTLQKLMK